jgi:hypothetical protein
MSEPSLSIKDFTKEFMESIKSFKTKETLVGIPESKTKRRGDDPIGNAAILYINNFGSPQRNIPPRPVMDIGIRKAQDEIVHEMRKCATEAFEKRAKALDLYYERIGIIASQAIKKVINDQDGIEPPSPATLEARKYLTKKKMNGERVGFQGTKALVVTGQLRNSITYVIREK